MKENAPKLGQIIIGEAFRDAIHIAVAPVKAAHKLNPGEHVGLDAKGNASADDFRNQGITLIGVVDPFLKNYVGEGEVFYLFMYPNTITGLRHEWTHPAFVAQEEKKQVVPVVEKSASEKWMRAWAMEHMAKEWEEDEDPWSEDYAYSRAIEAGHSHSVGNRENARDYIDDTWWNHWDIITGCKGDREEYFSCGC